MDMPAKHERGIPTKRQCSEERPVCWGSPELDEEHSLEDDRDDECMNGFDIWENCE